MSWDSVNVFFPFVGWPLSHNNASFLAYIARERLLFGHFAQALKFEAEVNFVLGTSTTWSQKNNTRALVYQFRIFNARASCTRWAAHVAEAGNGDSVDRRCRARKLFEQSLTR